MTMHRRFWDEVAIRSAVVATGVAAVLAIGASCSRDKSTAPPAERTVAPQPSVASTVPAQTSASSPQKQVMATVTVRFGTDRKRSTAVSVSEAFTQERGELTYGACEVTIPPRHQRGHLETHRVWMFEFTDTPSADVTMKGMRFFGSAEDYAQSLRDARHGQDLPTFVFVHGYKTSLSDALRRAAQLAYDLGFPGAPLAFVWPSHDTLAQYTADRGEAEYAAPHLREFLEVTARATSSPPSVIAHSMGGWTLGQATTGWKNLTGPNLGEVVLAAPDIDRDVLRRDVLPILKPLAKRISLYVASNDEAMMVSRSFVVNDHTRAGDARGGPFVDARLDTIDTTPVNDSLVGHSYFAESGPVLRDLGATLEGRQPSARDWLAQVPTTAGAYWSLRR